MNVLEIEVPDDLDLSVRTSREELAGIARTALALRLFELGKMTASRAAGMAGMPLLEFHEEAARHQIPAIEWDEEELAAEEVATAQP